MKNKYRRTNKRNVALKKRPFLFYFNNGEKNKDIYSKT